MTQTAVAKTQFRLRRPTSTAGGRAEPTAEQLQVITNVDRRLRVLAGPGTGKTFALVEAVADRIHRGVRPQQVLVLTFSRRAAAELTARISARLAITTREPLVRTLHGYAYSLLRAQAVRTGEPSPRLMAAGESDQMVRELLAGQLDSGRGGWPAAVSGALGSPAFAAELRDLMLRTAERGITHSRLAELGRRRHRPEWQAAARFAREYQDVSDLRQGTSGLGAALDQAELTRAALGLLSDDTVLAAEQTQIRRIFVDEYQDVDPAQARLVELLSSGADELVVFGDADQSIYGFRGSDPGALRDIEVDRTVSLTVSQRLAPAVLSATRRVAQQLPGAFTHRALRPAGAAPKGNAAINADRDAGADSVAELSGAVPGALRRSGEVLVRTLPTAAREAAFIADELRRAHLLAGVPWSRMAVLVRSPAASLPALRRAFATGGVPLAVSGQDTVLTADPVVETLLTVLRCGLEPAMLTGQVAIDLMASPTVGLDSEAVRRLRRRLRAAQPGGGSTPDLLAAALAGAPLPDDLPADIAGPVLRLRAMLDASRGCAADPAAESGLWQIWQLAGLQRPLVAASLRGGRAGQRADSTLDAVLALFSMAADLAARMPLAGVGAFLDLVEGQRIPGDPTAGTVRSAEAVAVLSAHAAKGLEWDVVCLAGVAEGQWPVLRARHSLLGTEEVLDAAAGVPVSAGDGAAAVTEERRLFYVAATRARFRLIATAVADQDTVPSRFLHELAGADVELPTGWPEAEDGATRRGLHLTDLIAELRRVLSDPLVPERTMNLAATQLARLAAAGVPGAHPADWYGLAEPSTSAPPIPDGARVTVSPSAVESLTVCALRGVLERRGARASTSQQQIEGIVVHALVDGLARGVDRSDLVVEMERFLSLQTQLPPWLLARTRRALEKMLTAAETWIAELPPGRRLTGSEVQLKVSVPRVFTDESPGQDSADHSSPGPISGDLDNAEHNSADGGQPRDVWLEGRADRLDQTSDGSLIVVDFKTGATVPSRAAAAENAQLAVYQLAINLGGADGIERRPDLDPGAVTDQPTVARTQAGAAWEGPELVGSLPRGSAPRGAVARGPEPVGPEPVDRVPTPPEPPFDELAPEEEPPPDDEPPSDDAGESAAAGTAWRAGGAELIYLRSGAPNVRHQPPLDPQAARGWQASVRQAAERLASSASLAQENRYCERCPVRASCPLQPAGRQVTR